MKKKHSVTMWLDPNCNMWVNALVLFFESSTNPTIENEIWIALRGLIKQIYVQSVCGRKKGLHRKGTVNAAVLAFTI